MYRIGIDIGSTYTKYVILDNEKYEVEHLLERTKTRQKDYLTRKCIEIEERYGGARIVSCGYGKDNITAYDHVNELMALATGASVKYPEFDTVLDIGGQDSKIIRHYEGKLERFYINDRCAAGSGMFLINTVNMLDMDLKDFDLSQYKGEEIDISSVCAVFAQTEIVELIAKNKSPESIVNAVIKHILIQAKKLLDKVETDKILLSGGLCNIAGIGRLCEEVFGIECQVADNGSYLAAFGCALKG